MSAELSSKRVSGPLSAADIDAAALRVSDVVLRTPLEYCDRLSVATGAQVYLKREDLQSVRSNSVGCGAHFLRSAGCGGRVNDSGVT